MKLIVQGHGKSIMVPGPFSSVDEIKSELESIIEASEHKMNCEQLDDDPDTGRPVFELTLLSPETAEQQVANTVGELQASYLERSGANQGSLNMAQALFARYNDPTIQAQLMVGSIVRQLQERAFARQQAAEQQVRSAAAPGSRY